LPVNVTKLTKARRANCCRTAQRIYGHHLLKPLSGTSDCFGSNSGGSIAVLRTAAYGAELPLLWRPTNAQDCPETVVHGGAANRVKWMVSGPLSFCCGGSNPWPLKEMG
jgi:hypothetical protein